MKTASAQLAELLETPELAALGPGPRAGRQSLPDLDRALAAIFRIDADAARNEAMIRALIFLWHDHLEEAHALAQEAATADGSLIHGILHRREPDYGNAKYWFTRAGSHPAYEAIGKRAEDIPASPAERALHDQFNRDEEWDPFAFVDCCQEEAAAPSSHDLFLRRIQHAEFAALLEYLRKPGDH